MRKHIRAVRLHVFRAPGLWGLAVEEAMGFLPSQQFGGKG